jgi:hypothetical protein
MRTLDEIATINDSVDQWRQELTWLKNAKPKITFYRNKADGSPGLEYYGRVDYKDTIQASFPFKKNVSAQGSLQLRFDHYIAEWMRTIPNDGQQKKTSSSKLTCSGGNSAGLGCCITTR